VSGDAVVAPASPGRRVAAEAVGSALLAATVVGSGIMGERLAGGNAAIALLANALATGAGLVALILAFGPISGAHFNPVVTCNAALRGGVRWRRVPGVVVAQVAGALAGAVVAHGMFGEPLITFSTHVRSGFGQCLGEFVATFGLIVVIDGCSRRSDSRVAVAVAAYITAAYWFTSSTSFANPALTLARSVSNTFSGIRPVDAPAFIAAQILGAAAATAGSRWLAATPRKEPPMDEPRIRVLFLCTGNSCRSQMAEALARQLSGGKVEAFSAGTDPKGVHPLTIRALADVGIDASGQASKNVRTLLKEKFDYVITVCDRANESCPVWPGVKERFHWSFEDPAQVEGNDAEKLRAFTNVRNAIANRIRLFLNAVKIHPPE